MATEQQTQLVYGTQTFHTQVKSAILLFFCSLYLSLRGGKEKCTVVISGKTQA